MDESRKQFEESWLRRGGESSDLIRYPENHHEIGSGDIGGVVMLVPEDMSVGWFSKALESVDEVRIITDGRINFIEPSTGLEKKGNSKGSMLLIWRPFISPRRMFTTVSKAALMAIGQGVRRAA